MKVAFITLFFSLFFISEVLYANYNSIIAVSYTNPPRGTDTRYELKESECAEIGTKALKNMGITKDHHYAVKGTSIAGKDNKGSFFQIYCLANKRLSDKRPNLTHTILVIVNNPDKAIRDSLAKQYTSEFHAVMKEEGHNAVYSSNGPSLY